MYYKFKLTALPKITNFYSVTRNTVWQISDKDNILIIITDGLCEISSDTDSFTAKSGDVVFIPANHSYCRRPINNTMCRMTYIHFATDCDPEQLEHTRLSADIIEQKRTIDEEMLSEIQIVSYPCNIYIPNHSGGLDIDRLKKIISNITLFSAKRGITCFLQSSTALCEMLIYLTDNTLSSAVSNAELENEVSIPYNLKKAVAYIRRHYTRVITLDELADCCSVSKQQVTRYFKAAFNETPINYIIKYKITKAKELLFNYPQLTVTEIAYELGFSDQHYFSRIFKKISGETPSHYKYRVHHYGLASDTTHS